MLKNAVIKIVVAVALLVAVAGVDIVGNPFGLLDTPRAEACENTGSSGGGC